MFFRGSDPKPPGIFVVCMNRWTLFLSLLPSLSLICPECFGQEKEQEIGSKEVVNVDRGPKIFEFQNQSLPFYRSYPQGVDDEPEDLQSFKLNFPILLGRQWQIAGNLNYKNEDLEFWQNNREGSFREYDLQAFGGNLAVKRKLKNQQYLQGVVGLSSHSDHLRLQHSRGSWKTGIALVYGFTWKSNTKLGLGGGVSYSLSRIQYSPIVLVDHHFNNRWRLNMRLPKDARISYQISDKWVAFSEVKGNSARYLLRESPLEDYEQLEFRRMVIQSGVGIERAVGPFLWFSVQAGFAQPLRHSLVAPGEPGRNRVYEFQKAGSPYLAFSLFAVPPSALLAKVRN